MAAAWSVRGKPSPTPSECERGSRAAATTERSCSKRWRSLTKQWHEQSVLDPRAAEHTALKLETELAHAQSILRELLARESAIAAELRVLAAETR